MKTTSTLAALTLAALVCACASSRSVSLAPIGPAPIPATSNPTGTLLVYSAYDISAPGAGDYEHRRHFSDYKILTKDGKFLARVHNDTGSVVEQPKPVQLASGTYLVRADSNGYGIVTVTVVLVPGRTTVVHLEGGDTWPTDAGFNDANAVRMPGGRIVGWRATETAPQQ
jgi:hypothetical protein